MEKVQFPPHCSRQKQSTLHSDGCSFWYPHRAKHRAKHMHHDNHHQPISQSLGLQAKPATLTTLISCKSYVRYSHHHPNQTRPDQLHLGASAGELTAGSGGAFDTYGLSLQYQLHLGAAAGELAAGSGGAFDTYGPSLQCQHHLGASAGELAAGSGGAFDTYGLSLQSDKSGTTKLGFKLSSTTNLPLPACTPTWEGRGSSRHRRVDTLQGGTTLLCNVQTDRHQVTRLRICHRNKKASEGHPALMLLQVATGKAGCLPLLISNVYFLLLPLIPGSIRGGLLSNSSSGCSDRNRRQVFLNAHGHWETRACTIKTYSGKHFKLGPGVCVQLTLAASQDCALHDAFECANTAPNAATYLTSSSIMESPPIAIKGPVNHGDCIWAMRRRRKAAGHKQRYGGERGLLLGCWCWSAVVSPNWYI
eukprot:1137340-Pelagomonas_calceolata.AAC.3